MELLLVGLILFICLHLIPVSPELRTRLVAKLGDGPYKGIFSVLSLVSIVAIVIGLKNAPFVALYNPPAWGRPLALLLMLPALYLFFSTSIGPAPSTAKVITAHPMSWGVIVWSAAHLLANGDLAHVMLFVSMGIYSAVSIVSGNARGIVPKLNSRPAAKSELVFIGVVVLVYIFIVFLHPYFTGMSVV